MDFIYSKDLYLLKKQIAKILKEDQVNEWEIENFSFVDDSLPIILQAIQTPSLFNERKVLVLNDCWFLTETKTNLHKTFKLNLLLQVLKNKNDNQNKLIFTLNSDKLSKRLKVTDWFKTNVQIKFIPTLNDLTISKFIDEIFAQARKTITEPAKNYLILNLPLEMRIVETEVQKILRLSQNIIELDDVKNNLTKYLEQDIFEISKAFLQNDLATFLKQYQNYRLLGNENLPLLTLISNNLVILRNALLLKQENLSDNEIVEKLGINPYRLKLLFQANNNNIFQLNDKIKALYEVNKNLVLGKIDPQIIPEYEFIKVLK